MKPNDIFENGNVIVTVGKDIIEIFEYSQNNSGNNNKLIKKSEININNNTDNNNTDNNNTNNINNINNFNNNNSNNDNEILCIVLAKGFIICGHNSGLRSIWKPEPEVYLKRLQDEKLHNGPINKILYTQLSDNLDYLISCSSDRTIKIYCMESNNVVLTKTFENEVMDIKNVNDFEKKSIFIVSLKNGALKALNERFDILFDIPTRFKTQTTRYIIPLTNLISNDNNNIKSLNNNPNNNENSNNDKGDLLVITEGKFIDVFTWIKEGSFKTTNPHKNKKPFYPNNKGPNPYSQFGYYQTNQFYPNI